MVFALIFPWQMLHVFKCFQWNRHRIIGTTLLQFIKDMPCYGRYWLLQNGNMAVATKIYSTCFWQHVCSAMQGLINYNFILYHQAKSPIISQNNGKLSAAQSFLVYVPMRQYYFPVASNVYTCASCIMLRSRGLIMNMWRVWIFRRSCHICYGHS